MVGDGFAVVDGEAAPAFALGGFEELEEVEEGEGGCGCGCGGGGGEGGGEVGEGWGGGDLLGLVGLGVGKDGEGAVVYLIGRTIALLGGLL